MKQNSDGLLWYFSAWYLSDLLAPIAMLSIANFTLSFTGRSIKKLWHTLLFALACGLVWELGALVALREGCTLIGATFDPADFIAYAAGGLLFRLILKLTKI